MHNLDFCAQLPTFRRHRFFKNGLPGRRFSPCSYLRFGLVSLLLVLPADLVEHWLRPRNRSYHSNHIDRTFRFFGCASQGIFADRLRKSRTTGNNSLCLRTVAKYELEKASFRNPAINPAFRISLSSLGGRAALLPHMVRPEGCGFQDPAGPFETIEGTL